MSKVSNPKKTPNQTEKNSSGAEKPISLHDVGFEQALKDLLTTESTKDEHGTKSKKK